MSILRNDWSNLLESEFNKDYYLNLREFLKNEYSSKTIYPEMHDIFNALHFTGYAKTKVVILGQDPYHGPKEAHGLCFSVQPEVSIPPSLMNIYKELHDDLGCYIPNHGCLTKWAEQGVLLLNAVLTVRAHNPNSHKDKGWEQFTDRIIELLNERSEPLVFILWGNYARAKKDLITNKIHYIIESPHPSPFSANKGFFGSKPFSKANKFLESIGQKSVDWQIENI